MPRTPVRLLASAFCAVLLLSAALSAAERKVIVISIDGLKGTTLASLASRGWKTPNLLEFTTGGAVSAGLVGVYPTVTYPSHTAIVTGRSPSAHGIHGNTLFDPERVMNGAWYWYSEQIAVPTLWDLARAKGLKTAGVYWPVTVGAALDYNIPEFRSPRTIEDRMLVRAVSTPGLFAEFEARHGAVPITRYPDRIRAQMAAFLIESRKPDLLFIHLTDYDHEEHAFGPDAPETLPTIEAIDAALGIIRGAVRKAGLEAATTFVITSDHGFRPVQKSLHPNAILNSLGLTAPAGKPAAWRVAVHANGGSFALIARDANDSQAVELATRAFKLLESEGMWGIERVLDRGALTSARGYPGAFLSVTMASGFTAGSALDGAWLTGSGNTRGTHGYLPGSPEMDASFAAFGPGIKPAKLPRGKLVDVAPTVAALLGLSVPNAEGVNLLP
ncbi:MAG: alkaline phosphatase family protein [Bryobacterales bacterium]|nr:alkaline phosphatase family protein [Bryobacterales bacterium]